MHFFKKFLPDVFNLLTIEEKEEAIIDTVNYLCNDFGLNNIPVVFEDKLDEKNSVILGQFKHGNPFICINNVFINNDIEEQKNVFNNGLNLYVFIPYYLMHTIAHECYHYYQYDLTKKLIDGKLNNQNDIDAAYLNFICLYNEIFLSLNKKINFSSKVPNLSLNELYAYSPVELQAEAYASKITDILAKIDYSEYAKYYSNIEITNRLTFIEHNIDNGSNLTLKAIEYNLQLALDFLDYKNKTSGIKNNYLGIDSKQLEESVNRKIKDWKKKEKSETDFVKKILKK